MTREEVAAKLGETIFAGAMMEMNRYDLGLLALETMEEIVLQENATPPSVIPQPSTFYDPPVVQAVPLGWWHVPLAEATPA